MAFKEAVLKFFSKFGLGFVAILQFLSKQRLFYLISFFSFFITVIEAVGKALSQTTFEGDYLVYIAQVLLKTLLNIALIVITVDNHLYKTAVEYAKILSPSILTHIKYVLLMSKDLIFYIWWWRLAEGLFKHGGKSIGSDTDQSTGKIDLANKVFPKYVLFFTIMNLVGLIALGIISFSIPAELGLFQKIEYFWNSNFSTPFDLILKLFPFKGLLMMIYISFGVIIDMAQGTVTSDINQTMVNST